MYIPPLAHQHAGRWYHAHVPMVIAIGTHLKVMCQCAGVAHQCNPTNTKYNLKSTMCTSLHWHIDIQPGVHTMLMRRWSVQLKSTMCTCVHRHIDIHAGVHSVPMHRWSFPSALPSNSSADVPVLPTTSTPPMGNISWNLRCVHAYSIIHIYINNFTLMAALKYI